uniref:Uncharacterized protein n=1 Tax=Zooxanthella nutricula TaxID=1333877 RepID=A0A6V0KCS9_9DINO
MPLGAVLPRHLMREGLAKFLPLADLPHFRALDSHTKPALEDDLIWWECASSVLPQFRLSLELFSQRNRADFLSFAMGFLKSPVAACIEVPVRSMGEARKLAKLVANASTAAASHLARGGSFAKVFIGKLKFEETTIGAAFEDGLFPDQSNAVEHEVCLGSTITVPDLQIDGPGKQLSLHFAWQAGSLLVGARDDKLPIAAIELPEDYLWLYQELPAEQKATQRPLTLDLMSFSDAVILNHRGAAVPTNAAWQAAASGIYAHTRGKAAARKAFVEGVLCVMCVRDGMPEHTTCLAKTLNLDTPQR